MPNQLYTVDNGYGFSTSNGNITASNVLTITATTVALGSNANVRITGGSNGDALTTDGNGNLRWISGGSSYGNSNVINLLSAFGSNTISTTGNVSAGNINASNITLSGTGTSINAGSGNILTNEVTGTKFKFLNGLYTATLTGQGAASNYALNLPANAGTNGQVLSTDGSGNLSWTTVSGGGSYGDSNVSTLLSAFGSNTITTTGNISGGNFVGTFANGNSSITIPTANGNINLSASGGTTELILTSTGANVNGTLNATGNANVGNLGTAGLISATGNVTGGNLTTEGVVNATGNVTGGNLTTEGVVNATGNVTGGNLTTGGVVSATGNVTGGNLTTGGVVNAGTLSVSGNANVGNVGATNGYFTGNLDVTGLITGNGGGISSVAAANIVGIVANATYADSAGISDTVTTAAQPNITSVGTLSALTVSGAVSLGDVANINIGGGNSGQFLRTNGSGTLSWSNPTVTSVSNGSSSLSVATGNVEVTVAGTATWTLTDANGGTLSAPAATWGSQRTTVGTTDIVSGVTSISGTSEVVWTATSSDVVAARVSIRAQRSGGSLEIFHVSVAKETDHANVTYTVSDRINTNPSVADTVITVSLTGSNVLAITCATSTVCSFTFSATEFKVTI